MERIKNPEQLQYFIKNDDKIKFCVKVFYVLQFVQKNPHFKNECGASWCSDGRNFISNSVILGNTLSIKPNTINANFRSHGFKIISIKSTEISNEFPNLFDMKNWKKRINHRFCFTNQSNVEDINLIPCQPFLALKYQKETFLNMNFNFPNNFSTPSLKIISSPLINDKNMSNFNQNFNNYLSFPFPSETQLLLSNDKDTYINTGILMNKISNDSNVNFYLTYCATKDWTQIVGNVSRVDPSIVVEAIAANYQSFSQYSQLKANILYLLFAQSDSIKQPEESLTFNQFLNFFLRYGCVAKAASYINDLTLIDNSTDLISNPSTQDSQNIIESQPKSFFYSKFQPWFQPSFNATVSSKILESQPLKTWLLRPSSTPGKFTLHYKSRENCKKCVSATYIEFNSMNALNEPPFKVKIENEGYVGALSWKSILFDVMKLDPADSISIEPLSSSGSHNVLKDKLIAKASPFFLSPTSSQGEYDINIDSL